MLDNLSPLARAQCDQYLDLLEDWLRVFNLTAITDRQEMITHHLLDSLSVLPYITGNRLIDVGTGAGFPGMVLAIARPELEVTLIDSAGKKTRFLQQVKAALKLNQVKVVHSRVEDYHPEQLADQVISRAFSSLTKFLTCTDHLCRPGGQFLAMKGQRPEEELNALPPGYTLRAVDRLTVPGLSAERHLIVIERSEAWQKSSP
jgi:16S rRNA (guanine527-N7)-methyltransferase